MTDALLAYSIAKMKQYGIVDSGDTLKRGIGAMTDARMKSFYDKMVRVGVVKAGLDYKRAYTLQVRQQGRGGGPQAEELTRPGVSAMLSFRGAAEGREPEIHNPCAAAYGFRVRSRSLPSGRASRGPVGSRPGLTAKIIAT